MTSEKCAPRAGADDGTTQASREGDALRQQVLPTLISRSVIVDVVAEDRALGLRIDAHRVHGLAAQWIAALNARDLPHAPIPVPSLATVRRVICILSEPARPMGVLADYRGEIRK